MNKGIVKFYDNTKRFGFIKEDDTEGELPIPKFKVPISNP